MKKMVRMSPATNATPRVAADSSAAVADPPERRAGIWFTKFCTRRRRCTGYVGHRPYDIDVTRLGDGPSGDDASARSGDARGDAAAERVDLDAHSAVPIAIAFAVLAVTVWLVRSIPRTLALTAIASLIAIALM